MDFRSLMKTLLKGLAVILPVLVIAITLYWIFYTVEATLAGFYRVVFPGPFYFPGLGLLTLLFLALGVGFSLNLSKARRVYAAGEVVLKRIPLVKSLYGTVQDLVQQFSSERHRKFNRVVLVSFPTIQTQLVGFVTREDFDSIDVADDLDDAIAVYFPMSYQIGGYMAFVSKSAVRPVNMSLEDATRFVFTAAMSAEARKRRPQPAAEKEPALV